MNVSIFRRHQGHRARVCRLGSVAFAVATFALQTQAATATASMGVSATIASSCTIFLVADIAFGAYAPTAANATTPLDADGSLRSVCSAGTSAYITIGQGLNSAVGSSDDAPVRQLASGATNRLGYQIYTDGARTSVWANTAGKGSSVTGTGAQQFLTVSARIPAGQVVPAGAYADTVAITITY